MRHASIEHTTVSAALGRPETPPTDQRNSRMRQALLTPLARLTHPRRAITGLTLATLAASALFARVALGSPAGDLDGSFDGDGKRLVTDPGIANEVLIQDDGKILVIGEGTRANDF